jgi:CheY-like chemotaxis protein
VTRQPLALIVDDNEQKRKLTRDVLRASGLETVETAFVSTLR